MSSGNSVGGYFGGKGDVATANGAGVYENVTKALEGFYELIGKVGEGLRNNGNVMLPNGHEVNINSPAGMQYFASYLQIYEANMSMVQETFKYIIKVEQKMQGMV